MYENQQYIYQEGDRIDQIFFHIEGDMYYVEPRLVNKAFAKIEVGSSFGLMDIVGDEKDFCSVDLVDWLNQYNQMTRRFTVQTFTDSEILCFSVPNLIKMKSMFKKEFVEWCSPVSKEFKWMQKLKQAAINRGAAETIILSNNGDTKIRSNDENVEYVRQHADKGSQGEDDSDKVAELSDKFESSAADIVIPEATKSPVAEQQRQTTSSETQALIQVVEELKREIHELRSEMRQGNND